MMWITLILRTLGLPLVIVLAFLGFYEGVPFLRDIPFIDRVPVVRELVAGRVATEAAKAAQAARAGYVLQVKADAAIALANEYKRQIDNQQVVIDAYQIQYKNALAREAAQDADTEKAIALNDQKRAAAGRKCDPLDQSDIDFLR
jgi:hypothetical protein